LRSVVIEKTVAAKGYPNAKAALGVAVMYGKRRFENIGLDKAKKGLLFFKESKLC